MLIMTIVPSHAQERIWDQDTASVVSSITKEGMTGGIFSDWTKTLGQFGAEMDRTKREVDSTLDANRERFHRTAKIEVMEKTLSLPSYIDENGIDLWMLSEEGVNVYLAISPPAYWQDVDPEVLKWVRHYAWSHRKATKAIFRRYAKWQAFIENTFIKEGIPPEMGVLCLIESGCTRDALSSAGARGMWQFMPDAARRYGLKVNSSIDERTDPIKSTKAAAKYLKNAYDRTGSWAAAAASYNCGIGRTEGLQERYGRDWDVFKRYAPAETRQYVPALIAVYYVWTYRDRLGL